MPKWSSKRVTRVSLYSATSVSCRLCITALAFRSSGWARVKDVRLGTTSSYCSDRWHSFRTILEAISDGHCSRKVRADGRLQNWSIRLLSSIIAQYTQWMVPSELGFWAQRKSSKLGLSGYSEVKASSVLCTSSSMKRLRMQRQFSFCFPLLRIS